MKSRLTEEQIRLMKDDLCAELAALLMKDMHCSPAQALDLLYTSETFERLQDNSSGFYYQSAGYVYSFLQNEIRCGKVQ